MAEVIFNEKESSLLLNLLKEYSEKLQQKTEEWYKIHIRFLTTLVLGISFSTLVSLGGGFEALSGTSKLDRDMGTILFWLGCLSVGGVIFFAWRQLASERLMADNVLRLWIAVSKLVRRSSQIESHGHVDFQARIALDLRLSEAEAALNQSAQLIGRVRRQKRFYPPMKDDE
jgi:hypothetical protein